MTRVRIKKFTFIQWFLCLLQKMLMTFIFLRWIGNEIPSREYVNWSEFARTVFGNNFIDWANECLVLLVFFTLFTMFHWHDEINKWTHRERFQQLERIKCTSRNEIKLHAEWTLYNVEWRECLFCGYCNLRPIIFPLK